MRKQYKVCFTKRVQDGPRAIPTRGKKTSPGGVKQEWERVLRRVAPTAWGQTQAPIINKRIAAMLRADICHTRQCAPLRALGLGPWQTTSHWQLGGGVSKHQQHKRHLILQNVDRGSGWRTKQLLFHACDTIRKHQATKRGHAR